MGTLHFSPVGEQSDSISGKLVLVDLAALGVTCGGESSQLARQNEGIDLGEPLDGSQISHLSYAQSNKVPGASGRCVSKTFSGGRNFSREIS